jgi:hypothetical protein
MCHSDLTGSWMTIWSFCGYCLVSFSYQLIKKFYDLVIATVVNVCVPTEWIQNDEFIVITFYVLLNTLWQSGVCQLCQHIWLCFGIYHSCVRHSVQRCVTECTIAQQDEFCQIRHSLVSTHPTDEPIRNTMLYSECVAGECVWFCEMQGVNK